MSLIFLRAGQLLSGCLQPTKSKRPRQAFNDPPDFCTRHPEAPHCINLTSSASASITGSPSETSAASTGPFTTESSTNSGSQVTTISMPTGSLTSTPAPTSTSVDSSNTPSLTPSVSPSAPVTPTSSSTQVLPASASASPQAISAAVQTHTNAGAVAGGVIGGVVFLACLVAGLLILRRIRARKHRLAPSTEFKESLQNSEKGALPQAVFRLRSGADYAVPSPDCPSSVAPPLGETARDSKSPMPSSYPNYALPSSRPPSAWRDVENQHYQPFLQNTYTSPYPVGVAISPEDMMRPYTSSGESALGNSRIALVPMRRSVDVP